MAFIPMWPLSSYLVVIASPRLTLITSVLIIYATGSTPELSKRNGSDPVV